MSYLVKDGLTESVSFTDPAASKTTWSPAFSAFSASFFVCQSSSDIHKNTFRADTPPNFHEIYLKHEKAVLSQSHPGLFYHVTVNLTYDTFQKHLATP